MESEERVEKSTTDQKTEVAAEGLLLRGLVIRGGWEQTLQGEGQPREDASGSLLKANLYLFDGLNRNV